MTTPIERYWHGIPYFDCERLNISIVKPALLPGQLYAKAVVIHLLTREENQGNHNEYFDVIDLNSNQLRGSAILGRNNNIQLRTVIDKPPNEFGTNFSVFAQDTMDAWVDEVPTIGKVASDRVNGFSTRWSGPIVGGQDYGHISIYVIWQIITGDTPIPPEPPDCNEVRQQLAAIRQKYDDLLAGIRALAK